MYIATVNILPSISQAASSLNQIVLEVVSFCMGVAFMVLVAFLE